MNESQLKQRMEQYHTHLVNRAKWTKGWDVVYETKKDQQTQIVFKCLHGKKFREDFFPDSLEKLPSTKGLADQCFQRAIKWCKDDHIDVKLNTWYSGTCGQVPILNPYAYGSLYGGVIEYGLTSEPWPLLTFDAGAMVAAYKSVTESLASMAKTLPTMTWSVDPGTISFTGVSVGYEYNAWSGPSILEQLNEVCPALMTVKRWCPECGEAYRNAGVDAEPLGNLIPHINDVHRWSREKIADWLDIVGTDPDVDLTIKPPRQEENNAQPSIGPGQQAEIEALGYGTVTLGGNAIQAFSDV